MVAKIPRAASVVRERFTNVVVYSFIVCVVFISGAISSANTAIAQPQFENVTSESIGLFRSETWGASFGDYNNDYWPDIFVGNHRERPSIYRNNGNGTFTNVVLQLDVDRVWLNNRFHDNHGAAFSDFDGDGDDDLMASTNGASDGMFMVTNGKVMNNEANQRGLEDDGAGWSVSWLDHNLDGRIDLGRSSRDAGDLRSQNVNGNFTAGPDISECLNNNYIQMADLNGDGSLDMICSKEGIWPQRIFSLDNGFPTPITEDNLVISSTLDTVIGDFDGDLDNEVFGVRGLLLPNQAKLISSTRAEASIDSNAAQGAVGMTFSAIGNVTFTAYSRGAPIVNETLSPGQSANLQIGSIGGNQDLQVSSTSNGDWTVTLDTTDWTYTYVILEAPGGISDVVANGLKTGDLPMNPIMMRKNGNAWNNNSFEFNFRSPYLCSAVTSGDFDNDMDLDLYLVCRNGVENLPNRLFENDGNGFFTEVANAGGAEGAVGLGLPSQAGAGENVISADYDNDGFLDLFVTNGINSQPIRTGGPHEVMHNTGNSNHWIELELRGDAANPSGVGARVLATAGGVTQLREQNGGYHRWAQDHQRIHFGLAANTTVDLVVDWPGGQSDTYNNVQADQLYTLTEGTGLSAVTPGSVVPFDPVTSSAICGEPKFIAELDRGAFIYKDSCSNNDNNWHLRVSAGQQNTQITGRLIELSGGVISGVAGFSIEASDSLETSSNEVDFAFNVSGAGVDGVDFSLSGAACLIIDSPAQTPILVGPRHVPAGSEFNLGNLQNCNLAPTLSVANAVGSEDSQTAIVNVILSPSSNQTVTVDYTMVDGSALAGADYLTSTGTVSFAPGETSQSIPVIVIDDVDIEGTEDFLVVLSNPTGNGQLGNAQSTVSIIDNEIVYTDNFEASVGWIVDPNGTDDASTGIWEIGDPQETSSSNTILQLDNAASGANALITGLAAGSNAGSQDIDSGVTSIRSQDILLPATGPIDISLQYYFAHLNNATGSDFLRITVSSAQNNQVILSETGTASNRAANWTSFSANLDSFAGQTINVLIQAADESNGSLIEAGVDDIVITGISNGGGTTPIISVTPASFDEGVGQANVEVILSTTSNDPVTVNVSSVAQTAVEGEDFWGFFAPLTFAPGETNKTVSFTILDDGSDEPDETVGVRLFAANGGLIANVIQSVVIEDNDAAGGSPSFTVSAISVDENVGTAQISVSLTPAASIATSVQVATGPGTATQGTDYYGAYQVLDFAAGDTSQLFSVQILEDADTETDETFTVRLFGSNGAPIDVASADVTITDNDDGSVPVLSVVPVTVNEADGAVVVEVTMAPAATDPVDVKFATRAETATGGSDFYGTFNVLSFAPGETTQTVTITILDDTDPESSEFFVGRIFDATGGAVIGSAQGDITIEDDD